MTLRLEHPVGDVVIIDLEGDKKKIEIEPRPGVFVPIRSCETSYPIDLIELILKVKGADYLCDEISRDIDPAYVESDLKNDIFAYFTREQLSGKRILDFGCGSGASSMILARLFPESEIVGVELDQTYLSIARRRLELYGYKNVRFLSSPAGTDLPKDLGGVDLVIMSAVYEHLLPDERRLVMPLVWSAINPGGYLFLNMTPHRWFPIEHHTTGLPLLNYLPDSLALPFTRAFSKRTDKTEPWETLLRRGIRGGTEGEIIKLLGQTGAAPKLLDPQAEGIGDRIDLWFSQLSGDRHRLAKRGIKFGLKSIKAVTGSTLVPNLSLAIQKSA